MLKQRVVTALLLAPAAILLVLLIPTQGFALVTGAMMLLALWEWTRLVGFPDGRLRYAFAIVNGVLLVLLWLSRGSTTWWLVIGAGLAWWIAAMWWLRHFSFAAAPTRENRSLKLLVGCLIVLPAWVAALQLHLGDDHGHVWALFALMLVWAADTSAYFAGSRWGVTKLAPRISPGKTVAGVYGALIGSGLVAIGGGWLLGLRGVALIAILLLALVSVGFSIVGDLFESLIKRHSNVKDSGTLVPGHGGVFDRLDSVFAALPVFALGKALLNL
jgi:phosphatidate cytidylyltransferase